MNMEKRRDRGLIGTIILIIVALALLKYFLDWSIFEAAESPEGQETIGYTERLLHTLWSYIETPAVFIWERILWPVLELAWNSFESFLEWGRRSAN